MVDLSKQPAQPGEILIEHTDAYRQYKRNLLAASTTVIILGLTGVKSLDIPGVGQGASLPTNLFLTMLFISACYFGWEFRDEYLMARTRYKAMFARQDKPDIDDALIQYTQVLEEARKSLLGAIDALDFERENRERWRGSVKSLTLEVPSLASKAMQDYFEKYDQYLAAFAENHPNFEIMIRDELRGALKELSMRVVISRIDEIMLCRALKYGPNSDRVCEIIEQSNSQAEKILAELKFLHKGIQRRHVMALLIRDGWISFAIWVLAFLVVISNQFWKTPITILRGAF